MLGALRGSVGPWPFFHSPYLGIFVLLVIADVQDRLQVLDLHRVLVYGLGFGCSSLGLGLEGMNNLLSGPLENEI